MSKIILNDLNNLQNENTAVSIINNNNASIEAAVENTLSRDGSSPNQMEAELDMNSNRIINLPSAGTDTEPVRRKEFYDMVNGLASDGGLVAKSITNPILADMPADTLKGRLTTSGTPQDLTASQVRTFLDIIPDAQEVFDTVADLQNASVSSITNYVTTLGYYTIGDGGGYTYVRKATQPTQPGYVTSANGAYWDLTDRSKINVLTMGAKNSDDSFDNTPIIQSVLQALNPWGGTIEFPGGEGATAYQFITANPFVLTDRRSIRITGTGSPWSFFNIQQPTLNYQNSGGSLIVANGINGVEIDHLNLTYSSGFTGNLIELAQGTGSQLTAFAHIHHCGIFGTSGATSANAMVSLANTLSVTIDHCFITSGFYGILGPFDPSHAVNVVSVRDCWFQNFGVTAVAVSGQNWLIESNVFEPVNLNTLQAGAISVFLSNNPPQALNIINNNFTDAGTTGIWVSFSGVTTDYAPDSVVISGNFFYRGQFAIHLGGLKSAAIVGNTIYTLDNGVACTGGGDNIFAMGNKLRTVSGSNIGTMFSSTPTGTSLYDNFDGAGLYFTNKTTFKDNIIPKDAISWGAGFTPSPLLDGDMWWNGTNMCLRVGGVTKTFNLT